MIGYEIKSGRQDFLRDEKWRNYLPLCNELWFVAEVRDAIRPDELPQDVGLLRLAGESRLITVRKAVWREIPPPIDLLTYVLMCRTRIGLEHEDGDRLAHWRRLLEDKEERYVLGHALSKRIARIVKEQVDRLRRENDSLTERIKRVEDLEAELKKRGMNMDRFFSTPYTVDELLAPKWSRHSIRKARDVLDKLLDGDKR